MNQLFQFELRRTTINSNASYDGLNQVDSTFSSKVIMYQNKREKYL